MEYNTFISNWSETVGLCLSDDPTFFQVLFRTAESLKNEDLQGIIFTVYDAHLSDTVSINDIASNIGQYVGESECDLFNVIVARMKNTVFCYKGRSDIFDENDPIDYACAIYDLTSSYGAGIEAARYFKNSPGRFPKLNHFITTRPLRKNQNH